MEVLKHESDLGSVELSLLVVEVADGAQVVEQFTSGDEVKVQNQILVVLGNAVHLDLKLALEVPGKGDRSGPVY